MMSLDADAAVHDDDYDNVDDELPCPPRPPPMPTASEVLACQFSSWYHAFRDVSSCMNDDADVVDVDRDDGRWDESNDDDDDDEDEDDGDCSSSGGGYGAVGDVDGDGGDGGIVDDDDECTSY